jgi:hypothetical protein
VPIDPHDLSALGGLVARPDAAALPRPWQSRHLVLDLQLSRRRLVAMAAASASAGLVAGLLGPGPAALAAPLASAVRSTFAAPATAPSRPATPVLPGTPSRLGAPIDAAEPDPAPTAAVHPGSAAEAIAAVAGALPSSIAPDRVDVAPTAAPPVAQRDRGGATDTRP